MNTARISYPYPIALLCKNRSTPTSYKWASSDLSESLIITPMLRPLNSSTSSDIYVHPNTTHMHHILHIDIETFSPAPLADCGVYRYAEHPDFEVLLIATSLDGAPVSIVDLANGDPLPDWLREALTDPETLKVAHNARFERVCLSRLLELPPGQYLPPEQWDCTMIRCARMGLPQSLDEAGAQLRIERPKMKEGRALISYFCTPCRPTRTNGGRTRNLPTHAPERWELFKGYCRRDVEAEIDIDRKLGDPNLPPWERRLQELDERISDRGVPVDRTFVEAAARLDELHIQGLLDEQREATGLDNPKSLAQLKPWVEAELKQRVPSLAKTFLPDLIKHAERYAPHVATVLHRHVELTKTSTAKYPKMLDTLCHDNRIRGLLQFHGTRTGRWAGRLVQLQNLPQNHLDDLPLARETIRRGDLDEAQLLYPNLPDTLSQLIRTALIPTDGNLLHVCDFSAIEARVLAWLAGEEWVLDVFRRGEDLYCAAASRMFGVPVEKNGANSELRAKGKVAVLALGYQGGVGALRAMGGERMGMTDAEMSNTVTAWRKANPHIVAFWTKVEKAVARAITTGKETYMPRLTFTPYRGGLRITLPSGRALFYVRFRVEHKMSYEGVNQTTRKWEIIETYGGKLTENIVQAVARDLLAHALLQLEDEDVRTLFHIHDEAVAESPDTETLQTMERIFSEPPQWAQTLPLAGAGFSTPYYMKD